MEKRKIEKVIAAKIVLRQGLRGLSRMAFKDPLIIRDFKGIGPASTREGSGYHHTHWNFQGSLTRVGGHHLADDRAPSKKVNRPAGQFTFLELITVIS